MPRRAVVFLIAVAVGAVFLTGLFLHGIVSFALLGVTDIALIALAATTWPLLRRGDRALRIVVIAVITVVAIARLSA